MATTLLIGLGNPDAEYQDTRHNLGIMLVEFLAKHHGLALALDKKTSAWTAKGSMVVGGKKRTIILARLESYVNVSGPIVAKLKLASKTKPDEIIIIHDDLDMPFGNVKLSFDKNSGGHRGVESVIGALKTKKFFRLRLGIANPTVKKAHNQPEEAKDESIKKFVLAKFTPKERDTLKQVFKDAQKLLESPGTQLAQ